MRASKGSDFEREMCRTLSKWWTKGERDDVFWRSSQSGGRATQRAKSGLRTHGSYGDITALDPIGAPLIQMFTIELKRGSSYSSAGDLVDFKIDNGKHPWVLCLTQAISSHIQAGSKSWMMICKRDHRRPLVYLPFDVAKSFGLGRTYWMRIRFGTITRAFDFIAMPLEAFLANVSPQQIIEHLKE